MKICFAFISLSVCIAASPSQAQLPAMPQIPELPARTEPPPEGFQLARRPEPVPVILTVSPEGTANGDGSVERPFASLAQAEAAVRRVNRDHDVVVRMADGIYRLEAPLRFSAADGGQNGFSVRWEAAKGAHPVISGGIPVTGWEQVDAGRNIWAASIPRGADPRQIWVNGRLSKRAVVEAPREAFVFNDWGIQIVDPAWQFLAQLPDQGRLEVETVGWFTNRHAMVERIEGNRILMQQPGWRNNIIGFDTLARPVSPERARLYFVNSLAFLRTEGEWFADPQEGRIYYKPRQGEDMRRSEVILPRLQLLVSIAGTYENPVRDLAFTGISFQHTSWLAPSGPEGYASQQSGAYLAGDIPDYPQEPILNCSWGCPVFEAMRNRWHQQPAAIQVAAATRISFKHNEFSHLGQVALGIGNNPDANESGIGLGTSAISIERSQFTDLAGGAIMVGGIQPDAHHPSRPEMTVADILISNNLVKNVSQDYREQAAILVTYASGAVISHNDVSQAPYDGIDTGWGWGTNDPGGSAAYRVASRDYYDQPGNLVYNTPTTLRDTVVFANRVHEVKRAFPDGGAIYHLSADPGALIAENYVYDIDGGIALYLDEGSRYVTVRDNVVSHAGVWLTVNSQDDMAPRRTAMDNAAYGNWFNAGKRYGSWTDYLNNSFQNNTSVTGQTWPAKAKEIIGRSGIQPE